MAQSFIHALPLLVLGLSGCSTPIVGADAATNPGTSTFKTNALMAGPSAGAGAIATKLVQTGGKWQMMRAGKPYLIKGAGGDGSKVALQAAGGNSFRTWGSDNLEKQLAEAQKLGMSVTVGIWLGHTEQGFKYDDPKAVAAQLEMAKAAIDRYKDNPAVLMWGIGNEMEGYGATTDPKMWSAVQEIAAYAHKVDPNHPTMTVVAEIGGDKVAGINKYCPDIDVVGINSYGGGPSIGERYPKAGGIKPYVLTEFGPPGTWEMGKNSWGAVAEPTSTQKADSYLATWNKAIKDQPLALGGYAFTWGNKQEASATWFGMLLHDGTRLAPVDALQGAWTGKPPANQVPRINTIALETPEKTKPGAIVKAKLNVVDPDNDAVKVNWVLQYDPMTESIGGQTQASPPTFPEAITSASNSEVTIKMPDYGGAYRLFAFISDGKGGGAVANLPLFEEGGGKAPEAHVRKVSLPFEVLGESGADAPYTPSGYMGDTGNIKMTESKDNPHSGDVCTKAEYTAGNGWGGVVWQSPANDWGEKPGGFNLTGAKALTFWARGENGNEKVSFSFGLLDKAKYADSAKGELKDVTLSKGWKQYSIDLSGKDLSQIKTGFCWTVASQGAPIAFYLDDIKFQATPGAANQVAANTDTAPANTTPVAANTGAGASTAKKVSLPLQLLSEGGADAPYIPAGYMGDTGNIKMTEGDTSGPHSGKSATKVQYTSGSGWGGVVWQSPANDWGEKPGGYNLTGAKKLTFWARGEKGGEKVSFSFGILDKAKYADSAKGEIKDQELTKDWKQYSIDLSGKDLSQIKTGFVWIVGAKGEPVTFYLDDIKFE